MGQSRPRGHREGPGLLKQRHQLFVTILALVDAAVVACACYGAWAIRRMLVEGDWPRAGSSWLREPLALAQVPMTILLMVLLQVYRPRRDRTVWVELRQVIRASLASVVALVVVLWAVGGSGPMASGPSVRLLGASVDADRIQLGLLAVLQAGLLCGHRACFRLILRAIRRRGWNLRHVAVIGEGRLARIVCRTLDRNSWTGTNVAFFVSHHDTPKLTNLLGRPVVGGLADLEQVLAEQEPDAVYVAMPNAKAAEIPGMLKLLDKFAVDVRIVPDVHPRYLPQSMAVAELDGMPILSYRENPYNGVGGITKRALDLAGAMGCLLVFGPVMLLAALLVRWDTPGPVIFRQTRVGLGGETFRIFKFRTMYYAEDEAAPASWTRRDDPRITRVGRWLRRTSLDELPQLFNVLLGQMSLVGPRPERPELVESFRENWRGYILRQHVKAGITGWAQVNGLRGDTDLRKRLQLDLFYIRNWSLGFDVKILWLTLFRGFVHRNAH